MGPDKTLDQRNVPAHDQPSLERCLTAFDLTLLGIGAIIGAGVFVLTGIAASTKAGPGVVLSYSLAGLAALFSALAYAELSSSIGGCGGAYNYAYVGFGKFVAWLVGWNLLLEYASAVGAVAIGWSGYTNNLLESFGMKLPLALTHGPFEGGVIDLLAMCIVFAIGGLLCLGTKESKRFNAVMVFIKLVTIAVFIGVAAFNVRSENWSPFLPFGWKGVMEGAALVFFAYIGFDALASAGEETINPQRNVPIGIIASLIICTTIYIIVAGLLTGLVPYTQLTLESPVADALRSLGYSFAGGLIAAGAIAGLTTVIMVMYYGLTRIFFAIARDGMLPKKWASIDSENHTPKGIIIGCGVVIAIVAGLTPIGKAAELVNIGTLAAFAFVCGGVAILRWTQPHLQRPFRLPYNPLIPLLGTGICVFLMCNLSQATWMRFFAWTGLGILIYFFYGRKHSRIDA